MTNVESQLLALMADGVSPDALRKALDTPVEPLNSYYAKWPCGCERWLRRAGQIEDEGWNWCAEHPSGPPLEFDTPART